MKDIFQPIRVAGGAIIFCIFLASFTLVLIHGTVPKGSSQQVCLDIFEPLIYTGSNISPIPDGVHFVERIIDGDTIVLRENHRVRLIGIDTPERGKPFAQEATDFIAQKIRQANNHVLIKFDGPHLDKFSRIRSNVYVVIDNQAIWLNRELVRQGLAVVRLNFSYSCEAKKSLVRAEDEAKFNSRGIWAN